MVCVGGWVGVCMCAGTCVEEMYRKPSVTFLSQLIGEFCGFGLSQLDDIPSGPRTGPPGTADLTSVPATGGAEGSH